MIIISSSIVVVVIVLLLLLLLSLLLLFLSLYEIKNEIISFENKHKCDFIAQKTGRIIRFGNKTKSLHIITLYQPRQFHMITTTALLWKIKYITSDIF